MFEHIYLKKTINFSVKIKFRLNDYKSYIQVKSIMEAKSIIPVLKFDEVLQKLVLNELILVEIIEQNLTCKVIL